MLWFFGRETQTLNLETRYNNDSAKFVAVVRCPAGHEQTERFGDIDSGAESLW